MPIRLRALQPREAVDFFRQKGYAITFDHRDMAAEEHQAAFTVAKATQLDLLQEIRAHVDDAIAHGTTLADFRKNLKPELVKRGWWGQKQVTDPVSGEQKLVQLGSTRRLKTIYDNNLRTAHSEGQWERIQDTKDVLPFLMYDHTPSVHERKEHAAWDGLVLRADDPWVRIHMPCRAWGCKCRMHQISQRMLDRQGLTLGTAPAERMIKHVNKRTGETQMIPAGVDPAFNYPPGGRRANLVSLATERVERLQPDLRPAGAAALQGKAFEQWTKDPVGDWPIGVLRPESVAALKLQTDVVRLSAQTMQKQLRRHPELAATEYRYVQATMQLGEAIQEAGQVLLFLLQEEEGYVSVVKATQSGEAAFLTSFRRLPSEAAKRDSEIQRLRKKAGKRVGKND